MTVVWPDDLVHEANVPASFDQDGADSITHVGRVMRPGAVSSVEFIPNWTMSGAATNSRTYTLYNGATAIATLALVSGVDLTRGTAKVIPVTAANATIAVGDRLHWESLHVGTGLPDPGGLVIVQQTLNN